ncbi:MAG TPA: SRPBCC domain-containing protein [Bryobacteraceae bacterium]|nr:SRPBCC domain-containing protein [Bryobacteraceae bacterium]
MKANETAVVTTIVAVDQATAFSVFTNDIGAWWKPKVKDLFSKNRRGTMKFEPGPTGRLLEVYADAPDQPFEVGRVLVWQPPERLVFEWKQENFNPGESTEVEVRFEPVARGTRVTLEHRGWDALPPGHPARHGYSGDAFTSMMGLRWADLLTSYRSRSRG